MPLSPGNLLVMYWKHFQYMPNRFLGFGNVCLLPGICMHYTTIWNDIWMHYTSHTTYPCDKMTSECITPVTRHSTVTKWHMNALHQSHNISLWWNDIWMHYTSHRTCDEITYMNALHQSHPFWALRSHCGPQHRYINWLLHMIPNNVFTKTKQCYQFT